MSRKPKQQRSVRTCSPNCAEGRRTTGRDRRVGPHWPAGSLWNATSKPERAEAGHDRQPRQRMYREGNTDDRLPTVEERAGAFASKLIRRIFLLATVAVIAIVLFGTIGPLPPVAVVQ